MGDADCHGELRLPLQACHEQPPRFAQPVASARSMLHKERRWMQHVVVLSGAGISRESGLPTFRDSNGLWEGHAVEEVATPEAWARDPELVLRFYLERRKGLLRSEPNGAHLALQELESNYRVTIITQNVDNLHERAGSSSVLHLHGELTKARSTIDPSYVREIDGWRLERTARCPRGGTMRPHIVWFGEPVPMLGKAARLTGSADILLIVGTSLVVYPAASLVAYAPQSCEIVVVDPVRPTLADRRDSVRFITKEATVGVADIVNELQSRVQSH